MTEGDSADPMCGFNLFPACFLCKLVSAGPEIHDLEPTDPEKSHVGTYLWCNLWCTFFRVSSFHPIHKGFFRRDLTQPPNQDQ